MVKLTLKQSAFIDEYIKLGNGTAAAIRAGYSQNSARITASKLLTNANIQETLKARREHITSELQGMFISDALAARKVMVEILNDPDASDRDKITAAKDLLDRAGFAPVDRKQLSGPKNEPIEIVFRTTK